MCLTCRVHLVTAHPTINDAHVWITHICDQLARGHTRPAFIQCQLSCDVWAQGFPRVKLVYPCTIDYAYGEGLSSEASICNVHTCTCFKYVLSIRAFTSMSFWTSCSETDNSLQVKNMISTTYCLIVILCRKGVSCYCTTSNTF